MESIWIFIRASIVIFIRAVGRKCHYKQIIGGGALRGSYIRVESTGILILLYRPFFFFKMDHDALDGESG